MNGDAFSDEVKQQVVAALRPLGPIDLLVYSLAAATAFLVAVLAGIPSARRAAAVQPIVAIRAE